MDRSVISVPCVDVVIPVYNGRETIHAALASVMSQQGEWIHRIIVVDDGSTDDTAEVVERLASPLIELVRTVNQGVSKARNLGVEKSTAEWIAFIDADDLWMPEKLQIQIAAARKYGVGFVCGSAVKTSVRSSGYVSAESLTRGNFIATSSVLVSREILIRNSPIFTPGLSFAEDYLAWLKCLTLTQGFFISECLVEYSLSARPRYRLQQIIRSFLTLNAKYFIFLSEVEFPRWRRCRLAIYLLAGSFISFLSILKRFIQAYGREFDW